jgi:alcohol dehydrogenase class IV
MLRHKLCHELGGSFGLPHAPTHTVVLPYAMAYTAPAAPAALARIAKAMRAPDAAAGVHDLVSTFGGQTSLAELGGVTASFDDYARAEAPPDRNERVAIVGRDLKPAEHVTDRADYGWAAHDLVADADVADRPLRLLRNGNQQ